MTPLGTRIRYRVVAGVSAVALGLLLAGCGSGQTASPTDTPTSAATSVDSAERPTHSGPTVTVPALPGASSPVGSEGAGSASTDGGSSPTGDPPASSAPGSQAPASPGAGTASPPVTPPATPTGPTTTPPPTTTSRASKPPATTSARPTTAAPSVVAQVCAGCEVLGVATDVAGGFDAALIRTANGRGALATLDGSGKTVGGIGVPYGASFGTPFGGVLPCDDQGFCVVIATQSDGHAIASAFRMSAAGSWQDVSGDDGFASETADARAVDVDGDGALEVAVQVDVGDGPVWLVHQRSGSSFGVLGCGAGSDPPSAAGLSAAACGS